METLESIPRHDQDKYWISQDDMYQMFADVLCFSLNLADVAGIDVANPVTRKVEANRAKYPVKKSKGRSTKYNQL